VHATGDASNAGDLVVRAREEKRSLRFDNSGFAELVRRFQDMAYGYAYGVIRDPFRSQDVVQESFLRAWERLEQLDNPDAFPGWFRRIVRRVALDAVTREDEAALSPQAEAALPAASAGPVEELLSRESTDEVRTAMEALPETLRTSVVLHYVDGYSQQQVADFLGITIVAVKKRIQRGRDQMRENLEDRIRQTVGRLKPSNDGRLLENVNIYTNFSIAAQLGQMSLLEAMLVDGIDVNEPDATGRSLLHWVDQHLRDHDGKSPRDIAHASRAGQAILRILNEYR